MAPAETMVTKGADMLNTRTRAASTARPDRRMLALGDMLAHAADIAARPGADPRTAAETMLAAAADVYAFAYACDGALAVPVGMSVLARVAAVLQHATGATAAAGRLQHGGAISRRRAPAP